MGLPGKEYWNCHFLLQGNLANLGIKPVPPALLANSLPLSHQESPCLEQHKKEHSVRTIRTLILILLNINAYYIVVVSFKSVYL